MFSDTRAGLTWDFVFSGKFRTLITFPDVRPSLEEVAPEGSSLLFLAVQWRYSAEGAPSSNTPCQVVPSTRASVCQRLAELRALRSRLPPCG
jgi:hypothetical protein